MGHSPISPADPAAILGAAVSLYEAAKKSANALQTDLSALYSGGDEFIRQVMRVANQFELWSCEHMAFENLDDVWPYLLEDRFGPACIEVMNGAGMLMDFNQEDCVRVAFEMRLPMKVDAGFPVAVDMRAENPAENAIIKFYRIQTVREQIGKDCIEAFTSVHDPFDEEWSMPFFGLYGIEDDGLSEHIADRKTYGDAVELVRKLAPGISFPDEPVFASQ